MLLQKGAIFTKRMTMAVLFWIFLIISVQTWSNLIKPDQNGFSPIKKCYYKILSYLQKRSKWLFYFQLFWIRSVKNGSNLIKLFGQKQLFGSNGLSAETVLSKNTCVRFEVAFWLEKGFFSNESALLLKVLKGLARLWWLKAFRLV